MIYVLDANSFIQAKNLHYRMNVVPGFWDWLLKKHDNAVILSIDQVYAELTKNKSDPDDLHGWAVDHKGFFLKSNSVDIQQIYSDIANYVGQHDVYSPGEIARFLSGADPWLIAVAKTNGAVIVTHEVLAPRNSTKVKIPNVAREFEVEYTDIFDLLELTSTQLVLGV